jgi:hypothetical protein
MEGVPYFYNQKLLQIECIHVVTVHTHTHTHTHTQDRINHRLEFY